MMCKLPAMPTPAWYRYWCFPSDINELITSLIECLITISAVNCFVTKAKNHVDF